MRLPLAATRWVVGDLYGVPLTALAKHTMEVTWQHVQLGGVFPVTEYGKRGDRQEAISPDGNSVACLQLCGGVRFGPGLFSLRVESLPWRKPVWKPRKPILRQHAFLEWDFGVYPWSYDGQYLAATSVYYVGTHEDPEFGVSVIKCERGKWKTRFACDWVRIGRRCFNLECFAPYSDCLCVSDDGGPRQTPRIVGVNAGSGRKRVIHQQEGNRGRPLIAVPGMFTGQVAVFEAGESLVCHLYDVNSRRAVDQLVLEDMPLGPGNGLCTVIPSTDEGRYFVGLGSDGRQAERGTYPGLKWYEIDIS